MVFGFFKEPFWELNFVSCFLASSMVWISLLREYYLEWGRRIWYGISCFTLGLNFENHLGEQESASTNFTTKARLFKPETSDYPTASSTERHPCPISITVCTPADSIAFHGITRKQSAAADTGSARYSAACDDGQPANITRSAAVKVQPTSATASNASTSAASIRYSSFFFTWGRSTTVGSQCE